jgi:glycogen operon protein
MIRFRRRHQVLRYEEHLRHQDYRNLGYPDFSWHGTKAWQPECGHNNLTLAFMLNGQYAATIPDGHPDDFIYVAMNMHWEMHGFELPQLPEGVAWHVFANTGMESPQDIFEPGEEPLTDNQREVLVGPRSIIILVGK